ncbi:MAG: DUF4215 domain-containing protein [Minisyncoccia bacterium]
MTRSFSVLLYLLAFVIVIYDIEVLGVEAVDVQTLVRISICGDGIIQTEVEVCDEGPTGNLGLYASSTSVRTCAPGCEVFAPYCGDGILQVRFSEQCDDGNHTDGDLCNATCQSETAVPSGSNGSPTVGSIPALPGGIPGTIPSENATRVVLRGKAYPNSEVNILLDGKVIGSSRADSRAGFIYSTTEITPGTATFGFTSRDSNGVDSITTSVVFEVVQSAVTTVANVFFPPTIDASARQVASGALLTLSGQTVPDAKVVTQIGPGAPTTLTGVADALGVWALQVDTASIGNGTRSAKAFFEETSTVRSGFGKAISFTVGTGEAGEPGSTDFNNDGKVNLVDFSIFLISWNTDDVRSDFNADGTVNLADFSIMLFNWTG